MHESLLPTSADADGILHLPAATEEARDAVMNELMRMFDALPEISVMVPNREAHLVDVENVPHHGEAFLSPALVAQFAFIAMLPALPSAIALQTAFGRSVGLESLRDFALLRRVASLAPPFLRLPLLCTIAWLHWAQGKRALAMAYLQDTGVA